MTAFPNDLLPKYPRLDVAHALRAAAMVMAGSYLVVRFEGRGAEYMRKFFEDNGMLFEDGDKRYTEAKVLEVKVKRDGMVYLNGAEIVPFSADFYSKLTVRPKGGRMSVTYDGWREKELAKNASEAFIADRGVTFRQYSDVTTPKIGRGDAIILSAE